MRDFHDRVRVLPGLWENAINTLHALRRLAQRFPQFTVGVNTVFMRENQSDLKALLEYVHDEIQPTFHGLTFIRGRPVDGSLAEDLDIDRYLELSRWIDAHYTADSSWSAGWRGVRARARHAINRERYEYIARQLRGGSFEGLCLAGEREYVMSETGDIHGCELIADKLGNVRESGYDFTRIRDGEAARAFADAKRARQCHCTHECNTRTMLLFERRKAFPIIASALGAKLS